MSDKDKVKINTMWLVVEVKEKIGENVVAILKPLHKSKQDIKVGDILINPACNV